MPAFTDQLNRTISLDHFPRRIISLVPSQTELLHALGLEEEVVGITKFCVHPASWHRSKTRVGGTKNIHPDIIRSLQPHLIIANKEENLQEQIERLFPHYPVWVSDRMAAGGDTFIQHMLERCGLVNIFRGRNRYPVVELEELAKNDCELVLLSSEPYPFREKHIAGIRTVLPSAAIRLVDGEMFSWYGSRLLQSPAYFRQLRESLKNYPL